MDVANVETPVGRLSLFARDEAIVALSWKPAAPTATTPLLRQATDQLEAYFAHRLRRFDLPLRPAGSAFQQQVYRAMAAIPFGATRSYGDIARELGGVARAVGGACGSNPIPILIPCHRVLATEGRLGGFSGGAGLPTKRALLAHEGLLSLELDL